ncbi:MAG: hypothetical protein GY904_16040 [Planctomycetaceae bacterium]|nr:hypothetical protein [Planctomycetaceae bacterium]
MPTSRDLKRKLKASAKRRSKRFANTASCATIDTTVEVEDNSIDVVGLIVAAILKEAQLPPQLRDEEILAALRACSDGSTARQQRAERLAVELREIPGQHGLSQASFRTAVDEMLVLARGQKTSGEVNPFLKILRVLAG